MVLSCACVSVYKHLYIRCNVSAFLLYKWPSGGSLCLGPCPPRLTAIPPLAPGLAEKSGFGRSTSEASKARSFSSSCSCPAAEQRTSAFLASPLRQRAPPVAPGWTCFIQPCCFLLCGSTDHDHPNGLSFFPQGLSGEVRGRDGGQSEDDVEGTPIPCSFPSSLVVKALGKGYAHGCFVPGKIEEEAGVQLHSWWTTEQAPFSDREQERWWKEKQPVGGLP